jgi:hypothetical protein
MSFSLGRTISLVLVFLRCISPPGATAQEIWLGPQGHAAELMNMFDAGAPWANAASHVRVFKIAGDTFLLRAPQQEVNKMIAGLNQRGIAIAIGTGVMNVKPLPRPQCGGWGLVEGYGPIALQEAIVRKVKAAGGVIKYVAMDEPLWYGHYVTEVQRGQPTCQSSIAEVARLVAPSLAVYQRAFPGVLIGDVEPSNIAETTSNLWKNQNWRSDLTTWSKLFRQAVGQQLAFMHIDVVWPRPQALRATQEMFSELISLKQQNLIARTGIIYNGSGRDRSDAMWAQAARDHMVQVERDLSVHPDDAVIQSWMPYPSRLLPESDPDTLTGLILHYVQRSR